MADSLQSVSIRVAASTTTYNMAASIWTKFSKTTRNALKTLQASRMMSALSNLSDEQLSQIGISRADIPGYANKLIQDEKPHVLN